jgi:hypothetical protein
MFDAPHSEASSASCHMLLTKFPPAFRDLATLQRKDPELSHVIEIRKEEQDPEFSLFIGVLHY